MNLRHCTDPEIVRHLQSLTRTKEVTPADINEVRKLIEVRRLKRAEKIRASGLLAKYRYQSKSDQFQA